LTTTDPTESKYAGSFFRASWFPDSNRVAFLASEGGSTTYRFAHLSTRRSEPLMSLRSGKGDDTATKQGFNAAADVRLSPDAREVAFSEIDAGTGMPRIRVVSVDGGEGRTLGRPDQPENYPVWSPDGRWIAVEVHTDRGSAVGVRPAAGGALRVLTTGDGEAWVHGWAPDNDRIVFAALRDGVWNVAWVSRSTGREVQVTRHTAAAGFVRYPTWSPRGDRIVYEQGDVRGNVWTAPLAPRGWTRGMRLHR
jgi:Tol biopolymer transport system component